MADPCTQCSCIPYENICCCPPQAGISVFQPRCQRLAEACNGTTIVNNPCYCAATDTTTFTYKFFTDCTPGNTVSAISNLLIPVCEDIAFNDITVEERIDGCGEFTPVAFTLDENDTNFGPAPAGFQWLKVGNPSPGGVQRYGKGACVEYRLTLDGDYPVVTEAIRVKAGQNELTFCGANPCFRVPGCPARSLSVNKTCAATITGNQTSVTCNVDITNTGNVTLDPVFFAGLVFLGGPNVIINPGDITVSPGTLTFNAAGGFLIFPLQSIGALGPGETFTAQYTIPITSFTQPGTYQISDIAMATSPGTVLDTDIESVTIEVVQARVQKNCSVANGNEVTFTIAVTPVGNSPATTVNITDEIVIPSAVTIQFRDFDGCTANVNLNEDVSGETVTLQCNNITVPNTIQIRVDVTEIRDFRLPAAEIVNTVTEAVYSTTGQVTLPVLNVPASAEVDVIGNVSCQS